MGLDKEKQKSVLLSNLMNATMEMYNDDNNKKLELFRTYHAHISRVYPADSLILTKMKIQESQIYLKADFKEIDVPLM